MQTFLPYDEFAESASALDSGRLGKQRAEAKQILMVLLGETRHWKDPNAWKNHAAVRMWRGYASSLCRYGIVVCEAWIAKGYNDATLPWFQERYDRIEYAGDPPWVGGKIHSTHRSNLLRKDPDFYRQFGWVEPDDLPYFWPA